MFTDPDDYYIVIPGSWGGKTATFGPMGEEEAQERLAVYLPLFMPECPPKLLRVVKDYAIEDAERPSCPCETSGDCPFTPACPIEMGALGMTVWEANEAPKPAD